MFFRFFSTFRAYNNFGQNKGSVLTIELKVCKLILFKVEYK